MDLLIFLNSFDGSIMILGFLISSVVALLFLLRQREVNTWVTRHDLLLALFLFLLWYFSLIPLIIYSKKMRL